MIENLHRGVDGRGLAVCKPDGIAARDCGTDYTASHLNGAVVYQKGGRKPQRGPLKLMYEPPVEAILPVHESAAVAAAVPAMDAWTEAASMHGDGRYAEAIARVKDAAAERFPQSANQILRFHARHSLANEAQTGGIAGVGGDQRGLRRIR